MPVPSQLLSAVLQLILFSRLPFLWYVVTNKRVKGSLGWIGLKAAPKAAFIYIPLIVCAFLAAVLLPYLYLFVFSVLPA